MSEIDKLFEQNQAWAADLRSSDPDFFDKLADLQTPDYLWIGCSDSRVPASQLVGLLPGEVFVHRNVANMVLHTDFNCQTALQFAVQVLKVKHVLVVGHYGCGGVKAAYDRTDNGFLDNWLRNIRDVRHHHREELNSIEDEHERVNRLCELNVQAQVAHVTQTTTVQNVWQDGQPLSVHGWIYNLRDGLLKDLQCTVDGPGQVAHAYRIDGGG